jgi:fructose-bisphosphate aldolase class I
VAASSIGQNVRFKLRLPWALAFSFARALQPPVLEIWNGEEASVLAAQQAMLQRAYQLDEKQGHQDGRAKQDWLRAGQEIRKKDSHK